MKVGIAEDGAQALEYMQRTPPDVALVDATMPGLGGLEVLARVKAAGASCEVIVMTAFAEVDSAVAAMKAGAYHVLTKPLHSYDAVAHAVARAAEHRRLADRARELEEVLLSQERRAVEASVAGSAQMDPGSAMLADLADGPVRRGKATPGRALRRDVHERAPATGPAATCPRPPAAPGSIARTSGDFGSGTRTNPDRRRGRRGGAASPERGSRASSDAAL